MPRCSTCNSAHGCSGHPTPPGTAARSCQQVKGSILVHVADDIAANVGGADVLRDGGAKKTTNKAGIAKYDPQDPGDYEISLAPLSSALAKEYHPPEVTRRKVSVSEGQVAFASFELKRKLNEVTPTIAVDKEEIRPSFPEAELPEEEDIHVFKPTLKTQPDPPATLEVTLGYTETLKQYTYAGDGSFTVGGVKSSLWKDAQCKQPLHAPDGVLTVKNADLKKGFKLYVRPETGGEAILALAIDEATHERAVVVNDPASKKVKVLEVNRVTSHLAVEHLVVLKERDLSQHQRKPDTEAGSAAAEAAQKIFADATRIELRAAQTAAKPEYTGKGKLVLSPANAKAYEDEACTKEFDLSAPIDFAKLSGPAPLKLWLRGTAAGKFDIEFQLDAASDGNILVDGPVKGGMGCAELKLKLFHYKKASVNKAVDPDVADAETYWNELKGLTLDQEEMTDAERIGTGRLLHVQKDGLHQRAKLVVEYDKAHFPDAAKDYEVVLDAADADKAAKKRSGGFKLFDAEEDGTEADLPVKLGLDAAAAEKTLWLEGEAPCDGWRGIRLSAGFDRPDGGPDKAEKLDGDWAALTVVRIKEVKCGLENEPGKEKFIDGSKVFINLDDKGRLLKTVAGSRKAEVTATVEPALKDLEVFFCIVEHADNFKFDKLPADFKEKKISHLKHTLKAVDKDDRKKLLHMSAKADDKGVAKIETLQVPQLSLSKFKVGAYLLQDVPAARHVQEHADLKKRAPTMSDTWLQVWRRLFFKVAAMKRWSGPSYLDRFDEAALRAQMESFGIEFVRTAAPAEGNYVTALKDYLPWARNLLGGTAPARTQYLCLINGRDKTDIERPFNIGSPGVKQPSYTFNSYIRFRSTAGTEKAKWIKEAKLKKGSKVFDLVPGAWLAQVGDFKFSFGFDCTDAYDEMYKTVRAKERKAGKSRTQANAAAKAAADDLLATGTISATFIETDSSSGVSWYEAVVVCMDTREPQHATQDAKDSASHTFLHEIGHYLSLAGKFQPDPSDTLNPLFYSELVGEQRADLGAAGIGPHCGGLSDQCIMWYMFKMTLEFCDMCKLFLRARALHTPDGDGRAKL